MINLPNVTVVAITTRDYGSTIAALRKTLEQITPAEVIYFSDVPFQDDEIDHVLIPRLNWEQYNEFLCKEVYKYVETSHLLVIQHDGFVIDGSVWTDEFLEYDYIGAPWTYKDGRNVGNGGFSLRSRRLHEILATDEHIEIFSPEDEIICRLYRRYLEKTHGICFAPEELAHKFSFEMHPPRQKTFGFHNNFHEPYREPVILKRSYAMGDVIMMEPVMEWFHNKGHRVILDITPENFNLFQNHFYDVYHISQIPVTDGMRVINLDMAYEIKPKQLVLKSYYEACGIQDGKLKNARLNFPCDAQTKMFDRYIVLHVDETGMAHRNVHGVDWKEVIKQIEDAGYRVFQIGNGAHKYGTFFNARTKQMLMYLISGADFFIGIDSGPAQIAVALGVRSIIFFGSVNPKMRYPILDDIRVIQNACPVDKDGCYHSVISEKGTECEVDQHLPPCITHSTLDVIEDILNYIKNW